LCEDARPCPSSQIFPVSAQKALVAKINDDPEAADSNAAACRSLNRRLSNELIPAKQDIVRDNTDAEFSTSTCVRAVSSNRVSGGLREQLGELNELRGKNKGVVEYMMGKVRVEKEEFESGLQRYYAVRSVFSQMTNKLFGHLGLDALRQLTATTREAMHEATFSKTLVRGDEELLQRRTRQPRQLGRRNQRNPVDDGSHLQEVCRRARAQARCADELLADPPPTGGATPRTVVRATHINTMFQLMTHEKNKVTQKFFEEVASAGPARLRQGQPRRRVMAEGDHGADGDTGARAPDSAQAPAGEHQAHPPGDRHARRPHRRAEPRR
jgi:hypothetical protein